MYITQILCLVFYTHTKKLTCDVFIILLGKNKISWERILMQLHKRSKLRTKIITQNLSELIIRMNQTKKSFLKEK